MPWKHRNRHQTNPCKQSNVEFEKVSNPVWVSIIHTSYQCLSLIHADSFEVRNLQLPFCTPLKTDMTGWKIPCFNRKYIDLFMVNVPAVILVFGVVIISGLEKRALEELFDRWQAKVLSTGQGMTWDRGIDDDANDSHHKSVVLEDLDLCLVVPRKSLSCSICVKQSVLLQADVDVLFHGCPWTYPADGRASRNDS